MTSISDGESGQAVGQIVILNGVPRSGKSSIVAAIQERFSEPWLNLGVDNWMEMTPPPWRPGIGLRPGGERPDLEPFLLQLYTALYQSIAAHSRCGLNVVVDVGHHDGYATLSHVWANCALELANLPVLIVGVHCPIDAILARRHATGYLSGEPGEPVPAPILRWQEAVHQLDVYDLEVDTSRLSPAECVAAIETLLPGRGPSKGWRALIAPVTVAALFDPPPSQWGLRGDPGLWREMRAHFATTPQPESVNDLSRLIWSVYAELTGQTFEVDSPVYVARFDHGGMSAGLISPPFWRETAVPLLQSRLAHALQ